MTKMHAVKKMIFLIQSRNRIFRITPSEFQSDTTDVLKFVAEVADFTFVEPYLAEHFEQNLATNCGDFGKSNSRLREHYHLKRGEIKLRVVG